MMKVVLKVHVQDEKAKQKVMKAVSTISGIESISVDMKEKKLTIVGDIDPVKVVGKVRKHYQEILSVGPNKEEKKDNGEKKDDGKKDDATKKAYEDLMKAYEAYCKQHPYPYYYCPTPTYYKVVQEDDNPSGCVIC